uniref:DUF2442 domain-containing protein n=1 Tax=Candidatus Kentrum sp. TC TaxID=2126339 RepID=A0A450YVJ8_9GAMM|nr:MAG: Protein of unknown function (DUF2442) [Candidatus Kentron sp. TC]
MDRIVKAIPLNDYKVEIVTGSGVSGVFDVRPYLEGSAFKKLREPSYFKLVRPAHHGISWPHGQDLSSDTIVHDVRNARGETDGQRESGNKPLR